MERNASPATPAHVAGHGADAAWCACGWSGPARGASYADQESARIAAESHVAGAGSSPAMPARATVTVPAPPCARCGAPNVRRICPACAWDNRYAVPAPAAPAECLSGQCAGACDCYAVPASSPAATGRRTVPPMPDGIARAGSSSVRTVLCAACLADGIAGRRHYMRAGGVLLSAELCEPCGAAWVARMDGAE